MNPKKYLRLLMLLMVAACDRPDDVPLIDEFSPNETGYRPVYGTQELTQISWSDPKSITRPGKIYTYGKYLLVNELEAGIHVYDNSNPQFPVVLGFLQILGNTDMAIKNDVLYVDHMGNLVALTISDLTAVQEKGRLELANWDRGIPPPAGHYFECVDASSGIVVGWKKTEKQNLKCYALR